MTAPSEQPRPAPTARSHISLHEIAAHNFRAVIDLDTRDGQRGNVSSNARSLCEAHYSPDAWGARRLRRRRRHARRLPHHVRLGPGTRGAASGAS
ncbi:hypothetical protein G3M48_007264 [Beauveria asiatica]|uniref:Uncharacterized protein n=1 Tax=Beauveria asiatica TaxID=1069075 RepID=A0AAW0RNK2_9HYPO